MAVKMRLSRKGRKKAPFYHIVVADSRSPRDGKFIEKLGAYNPMTKPATIELDRNAAYEWLNKGAQPTDTVKAILRFKGVYYKKHLMRGVSKGAMTVEQADVLYQKWIDAKESKIESRKAQTIAELESFRKMVSGEAKAKAIVADESSKEAAHAFRQNKEEVVVESEEAVSSTIDISESEESEVVTDTPTAENNAVVEEVIESEPAASSEESEVVVDAPIAEINAVTEEISETEPAASPEEAEVIVDAPIADIESVTEEIVETEPAISPEDSSNESTEVRDEKEETEE